MKRFLLSLTVFAVFSLMPGRAQDRAKMHPIEAKVEALVEKAVSTADMIQAYDKGITLWDAELNLLYQALRKALPSPAGEKLKTAQQQWLLYRDAQNAMLDEQYAQFEGTMYLPMRVAARMRIIEDRARYLKDLLETQREHRGR